ncbi:SEC-C metal-binding domain-containing protein [Aminipila sp.]|uniref:SEC-C metal-binding domain-containing protein n=1 Tax=Aminipila sp. TaxID=2060095 RepID=UPI00289674D0|nr:SEC-C metal-binding domain-containing protein [Aminipila sp.]
MSLKELRNTLIENDIEKCSEILVNIYLESPLSLRKNLLLSNSLFEPFDKDLNDNIIKTLIDSILRAQQKIIERCENIECIGFFQEALQIVDAIRVIHKNAVSNDEMLMENAYLHMSLSEQVQIFCIFLEDQHRLSQQIQISKYKKKPYVTGLESEIADRSINKMKGLRSSESDNFETLISAADTLFRFLYFNARKSMESNENFNHENITPYKNEGFEEIIYLSVNRNMLIDLWGKFKFSNWKLKVKDSKESIEKSYIFTPESIEDYKKKCIGIERYIYQDFTNIQKRKPINLEKYTRRIDKIASGVKLDMEKIFSISKKDFIEANGISELLIHSFSDHLERVYLKMNFNGINVADALKGMEYLLTIAQIYRNAYLLEFNQDDISLYKNLAPIIDIGLIINHFAEMYNFSIADAEKIINLFIFSPKPKLDLFSQPLIYIGKNKIVFCPMLIMQMNVIRIIEKNLVAYNVKLAKKGLAFEKDLRNILSLNPYIQVNSNPIKFQAFDDKEVEYDFLGVFEDHLLLIEFKHLMRPDSDKTKAACEDTIYYGINQVNRRVNVLKKDWQRVKELCSFELPEAPYEEDKIIKLVCTNIYDFTSIVKDGVKIVDSSSLIKFFLDPTVNTIMVGEKAKKIGSHRLWEKTYPTVQEFKEFLENPIAVKMYGNAFDKELRPILKFKKEDNNLFFFHYIFTRNPYDNLPVAKNHSKVKIGRNDPCSCGSGVKYKKCCGK